MRAVVQRVREARVCVGADTVGAIGMGLVVLVGVGRDDGPDEARWLARKVVDLRVFPDDAGRFSRDVRAVGGAVLSVPQFTLYGDASRGRRPDFTAAAPPDQAERLWLAFNAAAALEGVPVATGRFRADMAVHLVNWGPVTLWIDTGARERSR
jgi:D-tyrosyl-tRNA(Tyr) deacylase